MHGEAQINLVNKKEDTNIKLSKSDFKHLNRQERGLLLATGGRIIKTTKGYLVPSQSSNGTYLVSMEKQKCNCPDYETRHSKCKHIYAVEYSITSQVGDQEVTITKTIKPTISQKWRSYNLAQQNEKDLFVKFLSDITGRVNQPAYEFGRPTNLLSDTSFAMVYKVYNGFSGKRFATDLKLAQEGGLIDKAIPYNSMFDYFNKKELTPILAKIVTLTSLPLVPVEKDFAVDSTGFGTANFQRWFSVKHGKEISTRKWVKCHFTTGVKSNIITSVKITTENKSDCPEFKDLVNDTSEFFDMEEISADKAYLSRENLELADSLGATAFIPFKSNSQPTGNGMIWKKMYHYFMLNNEEFMEHYHKRSNVESTVQMLKSKLGSRVRSKNWTAQVNEVLCKIIAHNICVIIQELHEIGIEPEFTAKKLNQISAV